VGVVVGVTLASGPLDAITDVVSEHLISPFQKVALEVTSSIADAWIMARRLGLSAPKPPSFN
jgi:hypothetical protein